MIAPAIRIVDVDPEAFGLLNDLAVRLVHRGAHEVHIVHSAGRVMRAVDTRDGLLDPETIALTTDLAASARSLRAQLGADRVVLVDRAGLEALAPSLAAAGPGTVDQTAMLRESTARFWSSAAVTTDPERPRDRWLPVVGALRELPSPASAVLIAYDGERTAIALQATIEGGWVVEVSSMAEPPERDVAALQTVGAEVALIVDLDQLVKLSVAPDPWACLAALPKDPRTLVARGLPWEALC